jgi:hypothetical protein
VPVTPPYCQPLLRQASDPFEQEGREEREANPWLGRFPIFPPFLFKIPIFLFNNLRTLLG